ncbi:MAG: hypothetical protein RMA76_27110 [Deltaproteobacteria bacterium]
MLWNRFTLLMASLVVVAASLAPTTARAQLQLRPYVMPSTVPANTQVDFAFVLHGSGGSGIQWPSGSSIAVGFDTFGGFNVTNAGGTFGPGGCALSTSLNANVVTLAFTQDCTWNPGARLSVNISAFTSQNPTSSVLMSATVSGANAIVVESRPLLGLVSFPAGPPGPEGPQGAAGVSVTSAPVAPGADCATGGVRLEAESGTTFVCNGAPGLDGVDGVDGTDGAVGPAGAEGPAGPAGPAGPVGPMGAMGAEGSGCSSTRVTTGEGPAWGAMLVVFGALLLRRRRPRG